MEKNSEPVGYFWFSPVQSDADTIMEMHTACKPGWEGRWLTRDAIKLGYRLLETYNVHHVLAFHADPVMKRTLAKLGFDVGDSVSTLTIKELEHGTGTSQGLWRTRNSRGSRA